MITPNFLIFTVHPLLIDNYNYVLIVFYLLASIKSIKNIFLFIAGGIIAIVVGSFMIRGTMHMWDKPNSDSDKNNN